MQQKPMRLRRGQDCSTRYNSQVVQPEEFRMFLSETLGPPGLERIPRNVSFEGEKEEEDPAFKNLRRWKTKTSNQNDSTPQRWKTKEIICPRRRSRNWRRWYRDRRTEEEAEGSQREIDKWQEYSRHRSYRLGWRWGGVRRRNRITLCSGREAHHGVSPGCLNLPTRLGRSQRPSHLGQRRRHPSEGEVGIERRRKDEEKKEESKEKEGACKALPIAGSSRATGEAEEGEERKREEERKRKALIRGKGFGEAVGKEGGKEEEQGWWRTVGKQQFVGELKLRGRGEFIGVGLKGATAEEVSKEPRIGDEDAGAPLPGGFGSVFSSCSRGEVSSDVWRQTGDVFQSSGEAALSKHQQGHEGDVHVGSGAGSLTVREATRSWRRPGLALFGGPLRSKRRKLVSGQVPGDVSARGDAVSAHGAVAESSKTSPLDTEESRSGTKQLGTPVQSRGKLERRRKRRGERKRKRKEGKRQRPTAVLAERQLESMAEPRGSVVEEAEGAERSQGESGKGKGKGRQVRSDEIFIYDRGEEAPDLGIHYELFGRLLEAGSSLRSVGCLLAWSIIHATCMSVSEGRVTALRSILAGKYGSDLAMRRLRNKEAFPLRLGGLAGVIRALRRASLEEVSLTSFVREWSDDCWLFCCIEYNNYLHGCRSSPVGCWRKSDLAAVGCLRRAVERTLAQDVHLPRSVKEVEKELSHRFVSYSGGEVPTMEILTFDQVVPALPPKGHGGCIPVTSLVKGRTRSFLLHPEDCIVEDCGQPLPKLQAKCHILEEDRLRLALSLVERGVCFWCEESAVFTYRQQKVLNGLFGVAKSSLLTDGRPQLRCIMNLIPSNSTMRQLDGCVRELPSISQYLSITLDPGESFSLFQSDMVAAFYLFKLPVSWHKYLCFNLSFDGKEIGETPGVRYFLSCGVLPMGWTSAVSVMQELSQELLLRGGLPEERRVSRLKPLPFWLCKTIADAKSTNTSWWHIYLDNFFAGERSDEGMQGSCAAALHSAAEEAWLDAGVISSEKKRASYLSVADELGARLDGQQQFLGVSGERLLKVIQSTLLLLSRNALPKKWLQVITGRWIHIFQFKRAGMSSLHLIWKWIAGKNLGGAGVLRAREELLMCVLGACLFHTHLGAAVSKLSTASDASSKGGAVGHATSLAPAGCDFVRSLNGLATEPLIKTQCLVISLFNGIGGAFRCYDILGCEPASLIAFEIASGPNRVCSRRWPHAELKGDVKGFTENFARELYFRFPHLLSIHLWAGFPCVDLSAVKFGRKNLEGSQSSLFFEILRILGLLRVVFGVHFPIHFFVENVASMDREAAEQISSHLGVKPFRVQCADVIGVSRPRYCWTDVSLEGLEGVHTIQKEYYIEVTTEAPRVPFSSWIREGSVVSSDDLTFPTCMKSIPRKAPPPAPAGVSRCDSSTISRWRADEFRFPPYQYKPEYILWDDWSWRVLDGQERELSHGYGWDHTALCMSASDIKSNPIAYDDLRKSLIGDCFSVLSFVIFPWAAFKSLIPPINYCHLLKRMGMAPGFAASLSRQCPISRKLQYGSIRDFGPTVEDLTRHLLTRVNHTGSDVRVTTGSIMAPKAYPRQSASEAWWIWNDSFSCKWKRKDHINSLELRAILLSFQWRVLHGKECDVRFVHLTDSYVCMSVLSKGRSSSNMLMHLVRRCAAFCFSYGLLPILIHVESTENPTDKASRR